jgi:hypothetical protein
VATIAWLGAFIYLCKSAMQYAFALIGFFVGLAGTLVMVAIEVMLGGQQLMEPPAWTNEALIYGFIIAAVAHVVLFYAYKLTAPEVSAEISLGIETANITQEAMKQAESVLLAQRGALGGVIAPRLVNNVRRNLGLPVSGEVLDLPAYDIPDPTQAIPVQMPRKTSFLARLKTAAQVLTNPTLTVQAQRPPAPMQPAPAQKTDVEEHKPDITTDSNSVETSSAPAIHPNGHHPSP